MQHCDGSRGYVRGHSSRLSGTLYIFLHPLMRAFPRHTLRRNHIIGVENTLSVGFLDIEEQLCRVLNDDGELEDIPGSSAFLLELRSGPHRKPVEKSACPFFL